MKEQIEKHSLDILKTTNLLKGKELEELKKQIVMEKAYESKQKKNGYIYIEIEKLSQDYL